MGRRKIGWRDVVEGTSASGNSYRMLQDVDSDGVLWRQFYYEWEADSGKLIKQEITYYDFNGDEVGTFDETDI